MENISHPEKASTIVLLFIFGKIFAEIYLKM